MSLEQELELCRRIHHLAEIGVPLTLKFVKGTVYYFCEIDEMKYSFNCELVTAGR